MKEFIRNSAMIALVMSLFACDNSNKQIEEEIFPCGSYNKENVQIKYTQEYEYDIIPQVSFNPATNDLGIKFQVFNYGENLRIIPSCRDNLYLSDIAPICNYYIVENIDLEGIIEKSSEEYGNYGLLRELYEDTKSVSKNVFVSPAALSFLKNADENSNCLVYVRAEYPSHNRYADCILLGDYLTKMILMEKYDKVITHPLMSHNPSTTAIWSFKQVNESNNY